MTEIQLRDALHQIEDVIARRIEGGEQGRPSAPQALYLIDRIARQALHADAGVELLPNATMVMDGAGGTAQKLSA